LNWFSHIHTTIDECKPAIGIFAAIKIRKRAAAAAQRLRSRGVPRANFALTAGVAGNPGGRNVAFGTVRTMAGAS
jgi:hypothetical protein